MERMDSLVQKEMDALMDRATEAELQDVLSGDLEVIGDELQEEQEREEDGE